jgi:hypothetical protein
VPLGRGLSATGDDLLAHDFPVAVPSSCTRSSYFSPFRVYRKTASEDDEQKGTFQFIVEVQECPVADAFCCTQPLHSLLLKIGECPGLAALTSSSQVHARCRC